MNNSVGASRPLSDRYNRSRLSRLRCVSLTLFRWRVVEAINALGGEKRIQMFGLCKTRIDPDGDEIQFGCLMAGASPPCFSLELENPENGRRNPENFSCNPDYAPYRLHLFPDALSQFGGG